MDFLRNYPGPLTTLFPGQLSPTSVPLHVVELLCRHAEDLYISYTQDRSWFGSGRGRYDGAFTGLSSQRPKTKSGTEIRNYPPKEWWSLSQEDRDEIMEFHRKRKDGQGTKDDDKEASEDEDKSTETPPKETNDDTPPSQSDLKAALLDSVSAYERHTASPSVLEQVHTFANFIERQL